jgi:hypothetical protein
LPQAGARVNQRRTPNRSLQAALQLQVGPQAQAAPHWQVAAGATPVFWQPQVQDVPGQVAQVQVLGWVDMLDSSCSGEPPG